MSLIVFENWFKTCAELIEMNKNLYAGKYALLVFFISDFESGSGFTEGDLSDLVQTGQIKIVG